MSGKLAISGTNAGTPSFDFSVESQKNKSVIGAASRPQWMKNLAASVSEWLAIIPKVNLRDNICLFLDNRFRKKPFEKILKMPTA